MTMRNPIDFEKPSHQLNDVLFDVQLKNVFTRNMNPDGTISSQQEASNYKAVVNSSNRADTFCCWELLLQRKIILHSTNSVDG